MIIGIIFIISGVVYALTTNIWGQLCDKGVGSGRPSVAAQLQSVTNLFCTSVSPEKNMFIWMRIVDDWIPFDRPTRIYSDQ